MAFAREEVITCFRITEGIFDLDTGEYGTGTESEVRVYGNIQPISGKTLEIRYCIKVRDSRFMNQKTGIKLPVLYLI